MIVRINAFVPYGCDFLDEGWDIINVNVGPIERKFVVGAVNRYLNDTEVTKFSLPDFDKPNQVYATSLDTFRRI